jgi:hypothetical protein
MAHPHLAGSDVKLSVSHQLKRSPLLQYLFGRDGSRRLSYDEFAQFCNDLQQEIVEREFALHASSDGVMKDSHFVRSLLAYVNVKDSEEYVKRVRSRRHRLVRLATGKLVPTSCTLICTLIWCPAGDQG